MRIRLRAGIALSTLTAMASGADAWALPINGRTVASSGSPALISGDTSTLVVNQTSQREIFEWDSFSSLPSETVTFNLPGGTAIAVNRVACTSCGFFGPTVIGGALMSNGNVWVLDPNGVAFGPGAQVDVHGLLASTANLSNDTGFVSAALGDPISFIGSTLPAGVDVHPDAQITVRGGPAILIGSNDASGGPGVWIAGTISGLSPSSQVLLGATHSFSLRFGSTPPDPMSNSDLQLFDFVIDTAASGPPRSPSFGPSETVVTESSARIGAGTVFIAGDAPPLDPFLPPTPTQFAIAGLLESTAGPIVISGAGGIQNGQAPASAALAGVEISFRRDATGFLDQFGQPQAFLGPITELRSAGGLHLVAADVRTEAVLNLGPDFQFAPVPVHQVLQFTTTGAGQSSILSLNSVQLREVTTSGYTAANAIDISAGSIVAVENTLGGSLRLGDVSGPQAVYLGESDPSASLSPILPVSLSTGSVSSVGGVVSIVANGALSTDAISAGAGVSLQGNAGVSTRSITTQLRGISVLAPGGGVSTLALSGIENITVTAGLGDISLGSIAAASILVHALSGGATIGGASGSNVSLTASGAVTVNGPFLVASGGPPGAPALQVVGGGNVTFNGSVASASDVSVSSGGVFSTEAITAGTGVSLRGSAGVTARSIGTQAGDITLFAPAGAISALALSGPGLVSIEAGQGDVSLGAVTGQNVLVRAMNGGATIGGASGSNVSLTASGAVTVNGPLLIASGGPAGAPALQVVGGGNVAFNGSVASASAVFVSSGGVFSTSAPVSVSASGAGPLAVGAMPVFGGLDVRARDVSIGATIQVQGAGANFLWTSGDGALGDGVTGAFSLSNAEVQRITAPLLSVRGPASAQTLSVGTLTLDSARIPALQIASGSGGTVRVSGVVSGVGAPALRIGDGVQTPARVEVTGALGAPTAALGRTSIASTGDIIFGSQAFIDLAAQTPGFDPGSVAAGLGGVQLGQTFLFAGETVFLTPGAILSQNTGGMTGAGLSFIVPAASSVFGAPAATTRIDIFGDIFGRDGLKASGVKAALASGLIDLGVTLGPQFSINNCVLAQVCAAVDSTSVELAPVLSVGRALGVVAAPPPPPQEGAPKPAAQGASSQAASPARRAARSNSAIEVDSSDEDLDAPEIGREARDPGVGAANEDLWPSQQ